MFNTMQENIAQAIREALPRIMPADDSRIRAEEERVRRSMVAASEGGEAAPQAPVVKVGKEYGRNDEVTIRMGEETQTLKYKKAGPLLAQGWSIVE